MIKRARIEEYLRLLEFFPVLAITGPRQCGKTTIAKELIKHITKESIYLDMESNADRNKLTEAELYFEENLDKIVIIDEVQFYPELFPLLRSSIDKKRIPARFVILGSASPKLLKQSSESLAGRIAYKELSPFNISEIGFKNQRKHWVRGGFPLSYLAKDEKNSFLWLKNFINTYIQRDLINLGLNTSQNTLYSFWMMLANSQGDIFNLNNYARALGVSAPTIKKYLFFLEEAYLVRVLRPYHFNIKKRLVKSPKVYVRDSGVLHYLNHVSLWKQLFNSVLIGASWEGYVIEQLVQLLNDDITAYYYRTHHGAECDLVIVKGLETVASIEIKYSSSPKVTKGFMVSIEDLKTDNNFIVTPQSDDYLIKEKIRVCSLGNFITKYLPAIIAT